MCWCAVGHNVTILQMRPMWNAVVRHRGVAAGSPMCADFILGRGNVGLSIAACVSALVVASARVVVALNWRPAKSPTTREGRRSAWCVTRRALPCARWGRQRGGAGAVNLQIAREEGAMLVHLAPS